MVGARGRSPHAGWEFPAWGPGPAGPVCPLFVTLGKCPKGLQNHQSSIRFFTKSEHAKSLFVLLDWRLAKCQLKVGFGITSRKIFFQKRKNLEGFFATQECKKVDFSTFAWFLSRNATFFALKARSDWKMAKKWKLQPISIHSDPSKTPAGWETQNST